MLIDLENVPTKPGIYIWKKDEEILYIGKANNLKNRMSQYYKGMLNSFKTAKLVKEINNFEYIITSSEKEALVLEQNYIHKYMPRFNILLKDNKRYPYIRISLSDKLNVSLAYRVNKTTKQKGIKFYGPYPPGFGGKRMVDLITRITMFENGMPIRNKPKEYWSEKFEVAKDILSSGGNKLIKKLTIEMNEASELQRYEIARDLKETIESLEQTKNKQSIEFLDNRNVDVISFVQKDDYISISMLFYRSGSLLSKKDLVVEIVSDKSETIRQFINQYYFDNIKPDEVYSNVSIEDNGFIIVPIKGQKKKAVDIATSNALDNIELKLSQFKHKEDITIGAIKKLSKIINMDSIPHIMMIDNSNTNNTLPVSVFVSYRNGIKVPKEFRKYTLEQGTRKADVEYMRQGVTKYLNSSNSIPNLLIVDGGIAQINEAKKVAPHLNMIGLVKDDKHRTEAIVDFDLKRHEIKDANLLAFLSGMQIEVDRFAKNFHNRKRLSTLEGTLTTIEGVGPSTEKRLLKHFGNYSSIYNAKLDELQKVVSEAVSVRIKNIIK